MRLMQADCEVTYDGRGYTTLPRGHRLVITKDDGSVAIHQDKGIRPLNYMSKSTELSQYVDDEGFEHFYASSNKESIDIKIYSVLFETFLDFPDEAELQRQGTEKQLQAWLANEENLRATIGERISFVTREYATGKGPVDLLGMDKVDGQAALIEVKRYAKRNDCFQLVRYQTALRERRAEAVADGQDDFVTTAQKDAVRLPVESAEDPHMILIAPKFHRGVAEECKRRGIIGFEIGNGWMETADFDMGQHKDEIVGMAKPKEEPAGDDPAKAKPKRGRKGVRRLKGGEAALMRKRILGDEANAGDSGGSGQGTLF